MIMTPIWSRSLPLTQGHIKCAIPTCGYNHSSRSAILKVDLAMAIDQNLADSGPPAMEKGGNGGDGLP